MWYRCLMLLCYAAAKLELHYKTFCLRCVARIDAVKWTFSELFCKLMSRPSLRISYCLLLTDAGWIDYTKQLNYLVSVMGFFDSVHLYYLDQIIATDTWTLLYYINKKMYCICRADTVTFGVCNPDLTSLNVTVVNKLISLVDAMSNKTRTYEDDKKKKLIAVDLLEQILKSK